MAINLTNPMSGDAFKAEVEKALDRTTGGVINGKIYKENEDPKSEYITKEFIDDFVYYLNNVSPITLKRDDSGNVVLSGYMDIYNKAYTPIDQDIVARSTYTLSDVYNFNFNECILGYKSPARTIRINLSQYCSKQVSDGFGDPLQIEYDFFLRDDNDNVVYSRTGRKEFMYKGDRNFCYDIDASILKENTIYRVYMSIKTPSANSFKDSIRYSLSFKSIQEQAALRDVIEY